MSEEQRENYCKWCDTVTNSIVKEFDKGYLIWVGCSECYIKKKEREQKDDKKK